jgi:hypothetical protein
MANKKITHYIKKRGGQSAKVQLVRKAKGLWNVLINDKSTDCVLQEWGKFSDGTWWSLDYHREDGNVKGLMGYNMKYEGLFTNQLSRSVYNVIRKNQK